MAKNKWRSDVEHCKLPNDQRLTIHPIGLAFLGTVDLSQSYGLNCVKPLEQDGVTPLFFNLDPYTVS